YLCVYSSTHFFYLSLHDALPISTDFSKNKSNNTPSATGINSPSKQNTVTVDIPGAVKHSGVYTLKNGARLNDLLKVCGGLTDKRSEEHTSELQSRFDIVCRLLLE